MLKRTLIALLLTLLTATAATAQGPNPPVVRDAAMLRIEKMPPNPAVSNEALYYSHLAVEAAKQWMIEHGYLFDANLGLQVYFTENAVLGVFSEGGHQTAFVLGPGPFLPRPERDHVDIAFTMVSRAISNGF